MSTREAAKKRTEREHLDRFLEIHLSNEVKNVCPSERPDFVVYLNDGRSIAIEHALGISQHQKSADKSASALAREIEDELRRRDLTALIMFGINVDRGRVEPGQRRRIAELLGDYAECLREEEIEVPDIPPLRNIRVRPDSGVVVINSAGGMSRGANPVGRTIETHGRKTDEYRANTNAGELWMLVVSGVGGQGAVDHDELRGATFHSCGFDRAFFLDLFYLGEDAKRGLVVELQLVQASQSG